MESSPSATPGLGTAGLALPKPKQQQSLGAVFLSLIGVAAKVALGYFAIVALLVLVHFPY